MDPGDKRRDDSHDTFSRTPSGTGSVQQILARAVAQMARAAGEMHRLADAAILEVAARLACVWQVQK
jgi:hypothetical protein